jgi:hypothetical protein
VRQLRIALGLVATATLSLHAQKPAPAAKSSGPPLLEANVAVPAMPGLPTPRLKLTPGLLIDGRREQIDKALRVNLGPAGQMVIEVGPRMLRGYDSTGRRRWAMNMRQEDEVGTVDAIGWRGSEMWVSDSRYGQVALVDRGAVTKSIEMPTWIRPRFNDRNAFPVFGRADVRALFSDGSMLVIPSHAHSVVGGAGYDSTMRYLLRVNEDGVIDGVVARFPSLDAAQMAAWMTSARTHLDVPNRWLFQPDFWPRLRVSFDGARVVTVSTDTTGASADSIVVAMVNDRGQPMWTRKFGFARRAFSQHETDSIAKLRFSRGEVEARARQIRGIQRKLPSVHDVVIGRDYSVWISLRDENSVRPIVGFDAAGQPIGTAYVPNTFVVKAADRGVVWIVDDRWTAKTIVRYAVSR